MSETHVPEGGTVPAFAPKKHRRTRGPAAWRPMNIRLIGAAGVVAIASLTACGASGGASQSQQSQQTGATAIKGPDTFDSIKVVGTDIQAGTYVTDGVRHAPWNDNNGFQGTDGCTYEVLYDGDGIHVISTPATTKVTVRDGESLSVSGGCEWRLMS